MLKLTLCLMTLLITQMTVAQECIEYVVDDQCATWSQQTGDCITCIAGYRFATGKCLPKGKDSQPQSKVDDSKSSPIQDNSEFDKNCGQFKNGKCLRCAWRSVNVNGKCTAVNSLCATWDENTALCASCYGGYTLTSDGKCFVS